MPLPTITMPLADAATMPCRLLPLLPFSLLMLLMPRFRYAAADAGDFRHFTPLLRHFRHLPLTAGAR
jgi:hypothetical protein